MVLYQLSILPCSKKVLTVSCSANIWRYILSLFFSSLGYSDVDSVNSRCQVNKTVHVAVIRSHTPQNVIWQPSLNPRNLILVSWHSRIEDRETRYSQKCKLEKKLLTWKENVMFNVEYYVFDYLAAIFQDIEWKKWFVTQGSRGTVTEIFLYVGQKCSNIS